MKPLHENDPPVDLDRPFEPDLADVLEERVEPALRPSTFEEWVGQERVVENLSIAIQTAKRRGEALDHVLFSGMPGLGKTTLSRLVAREMDVEIQSTSGPVLERGADLLGFVTNLKKGSILFIDEIHRMSSEAEEYLYSAMEDYQVDVVVDRGPDARTYRIPLEPFTLIGATTRTGLLSAPFRSRFGIQEKLEPYPPGELARIVTRSAGLLGTAISDDAAFELARRSRGTPRFANRFLRRVRDVAQFNSSLPGVGIELPSVNEGLERLGVDRHGLDRVDRMILALLLKQSQPVGLKTIAVTVGEDERTIEDVYEPYLIQRGLLIKTPRGRQATQESATLLEVGH